MRSRSLLRTGFLLSLFILSGKLAAGHDLSTSYAFLRLKSDKLELEIKIAAEAAWSVVQQTVAPGAVFVLEDFEKVGQPQLVAFARLMEELTIDGKVVSPRDIAVVVSEDNFIFTFDYLRPPRGALRLKENYLLKLSPDYASRVSFVDEENEPILSKTLTRANLSFETNLPALKSKAPATSAVPVAPTAK